MIDAWSTAIGRGAGGGRRTGFSSSSPRLPGADKTTGVPGAQLGGGSVEHACEVHERRLDRWQLRDVAVGDGVRDRCKTGANQHLDLELASASCSRRRSCSLRGTGDPLTREASAAAELVVAAHTSRSTAEASPGLASHPLEQPSPCEGGTLAPKSPLGERRRPMPSNNVGRNLVIRVVQAARRGRVVILDFFERKTTRAPSAATRALR